MGNFKFYELKYFFAYKKNPHSVSHLLIDNGVNCPMLSERGY